VFFVLSAFFLAFLAALSSSLAMMVGSQKKVTKNLSRDSLAFGGQSFLVNFKEANRSDCERASPSGESLRVFLKKKASRENGQMFFFVEWYEY
jgi:hypothetical protein